MNDPIEHDGEMTLSVTHPEPPATWRLLLIGRPEEKIDLDALKASADALIASIKERGH